MTRDELQQKAREQLGVKYKHQGRTAFEQLDCIGLVLYVMDSFNLRYEDVTNYKPIPGKNLLEQNLAKWMVEQPKGYKPLVGDICLFWFQSPGHPCHVGMVTDFDGMGLIHTYTQARKVCEVTFTRYWQHRLFKTYTLKGVE